jgi:uncharacterized repeat protein (TIGR03803 family)
LLEYSPGVFYGTNTAGGIGQGVMFSFEPATSTYTRLWTFQTASGSVCYSSLKLASNGLVYGMTSAGGTNGKGVIFAYDPSIPTYTAVHQLDASSLATPYTGLMEDPVGQLNGTCSAGGAFSLGALFRLNISTNAVSILANMGDSNGAYPWGRLTRASNGMFYGVTSGGGTSNSGVLFSYDPATSTYTKLVDFGPTNGRYPFGKLTLVGNILYGLCSQGGTSSGGTLFSFDIGSNTFTVLQNLTAATGTNPQAGMIQASNGQLYGTCSEGGTGFGTLFRYVIATNTLTVVRSLTNADGSTPVADMMEASNGMLYGTLSEGGSFGSGSLYRIDPTTNTFTRLADFDASLGSGPSGEMAEIGGTL